MYHTVVFLTNLWMRLFPNYKEYFFYSRHAQACDERAFAIYCDYHNRPSTQSRGYLLPNQLAEVNEVKGYARMFDEIARNCMRPITVKMLKCKPECKL